MNTELEMHVYHLDDQIWSVSQIDLHGLDSESNFVALAYPTQYHTMSFY